MIQHVTIAASAVDEYLVHWVPDPNGGLLNSGVVTACDKLLDLSCCANSEHTKIKCPDCLAAYAAGRLKADEKFSFSEILQTPGMRDLFSKSAAEAAIKDAAFTNWLLQPKKDKP